MASSSSLSSSFVLKEKYDVFLSFRGEDTRNNFTSHLYAALCKKKIQTFFDEDKLKRGDDISPALLKAIEESKISIIIFSKNYASSTWCLDELVKILECKESNDQMVIPVFYQVNPSDLRKQTGSIGDAFVNHEKCFDKIPEKVQRWRAALTKASEISGWDSMATRPEAKLVDEIVGYILKKLMSDISPSSCCECLIGIEEHFEHIKSLLSSFRVVGIWGMGGIGKTTIAKFVFNQISPHFEGCCFVENVREELAKEGPRLKEQLLSVLLDEKIDTFHIVNTPIELRFLRKKVLIVLDDVNDFKQLEELIGGLNFSSGSRVIVTMRDRQILSQLDGRTIYEVKELHHAHAFKLFSSYAFKPNPQSKDLLELSKRIVGYVKGHPLALKVLGSSLCGKSKKEWESAVHTLKKFLNNDILKILRISYDGLDDATQKNIFLDIACFFKGWEFDHVTKILDRCYKSLDYDLSVLIDKSLITRTKWNAIEMHDLLQQMGCT